MPIPDRYQWIQCDLLDVAPPKTRRQPGRPKKLRRRGQMSCGHCGMVGHKISVNQTTTTPQQFQPANQQQISMGRSRRIGRRHGNGGRERSQGGSAQAGAVSVSRGNDGSVAKDTINRGVEGMDLIYFTSCLPLLPFSNPRISALNPLNPSDKIMRIGEGVFSSQGSSIGHYTPQNRGDTFEWFDDD
ncbi:hypothetical protein M9H77_31849 [Catharanthus roseus]|uniref:Uncharacterized protein n=1 Tax=Catharanthus roseus TaxID=4058 RepID=A0ACC0A3X8_CATRO|nr:hypothetical protein M9H77_31849 [Catharanthus roseus]